MKQKTVDIQSTKGLISVEQNLKIGTSNGVIGIRKSEDGRIWICLNGQSFIRFNPNIRLSEEED